MLANIIAGIIVVAIFFGACAYIYSFKKKGGATKCIGCPSAGSCSGGCSGCGGGASTSGKNDAKASVTETQTENKKE